MTEENHRKLLREKLVRGTQRTTWFDGHDIIKEYRRKNWPGDLRFPWKKEHRALIKLQAASVASPISYGYKTLSSGFVQHRRQYLNGEVIHTPDKHIITELAKHLAQIHAARVVTCDPSLDNFLIKKDRECICVDYGRARTFLYRGPYFYFYVGKELSRFIINFFLEDSTLWNHFITVYKKQVNYTDWGWWIIRYSQAYWLKRKKVKLQKIHDDYKIGL